MRGDDEEVDKSITNGCQEDGMSSTSKLTTSTNRRKKRKKSPDLTQEIKDSLKRSEELPSQVMIQVI